MLAILSAPGSRGDVNPMIAIGRQLRQRGVEVVISLAETYADLARSADLQVEPVIDRQRFDQLLSDPRVWTTLGGPRAVLGVACDYLSLHDDVIRRHHRPGETILVAHPLDFASRIHRDADPTTPMAHVHLAPSILRTLDDPPRLSPWWFEMSKPRWVVKTAYRFADAIAVDPTIRGPVNRLRADYGLPSVKRIMDRWWLSPDAIIAMYPEWFAPATAGFCPQIVHAGFPCEDADDHDFTPPEDRPIVFTAGTAHHHCQSFFRRAAEACRSIGHSGLLVSTHADNFPDPLPPHVKATDYVSFGKLLPSCAAIVHHGGIGTTSQAFASATPQVIRPHAFDQFDNARRVQRLGCGTWLKKDSGLADALRHLLTSAEIGAKCQQVAKKMRDRSSRHIAAETIIGLLPK